MNVMKYTNFANERIVLASPAKAEIHFEERNYVNISVRTKADIHEGER